MSKEVYGYVIPFKDRLELCLMAIKTYVHYQSLEDPTKSLSSRPLEFLSYYLLEGYSKETKDFMQKTMNVNVKNINTVNSNLSKKGYLINDRYNYNKKHLNPDLKKLKEYLDNGKDVSKFMLLKFKRDVV